MNNELAVLSKKNRGFIFILMCVAIIFGMGGFFLGNNLYPLYTPMGLPSTQSVANQNDTQKQVSRRGESTNLKFFYGYVIDKKGSELLVQEVLLNGLYGASMYLVNTDDHTQYEYVAKVDSKEASEYIKPQGKQGNFADIEKKMYVFVATRDRLVSTPSIYAASISYSQAHPLRPQSADTN